MNSLAERPMALQCLKPSLDLWFDKDTHTYLRHQKPVGSVTQVLKAVGIIGNDVDFVSEEYLWRGSCIHKGIELVNKGTIDWESVDDTEVMPYLKAYQDFLRTTRFEPLLVEHPVFDPVLGVAGTFDVMGTFPGGGEAILDIKTGTAKPFAGIQLAGYDYLLSAERKTVDYRIRYALELKGGKPRLVQFQDPMRDRAIFLSACSIWNWKQNRRLK